MTRKEEMLQLILAAELAGNGIIYGVTSRGRDFSTEIRLIPHAGLVHEKQVFTNSYDEDLYLTGTSIRITQFKLLGREDYESQRTFLCNDAEGCREPR